MLVGVGAGFGAVVFRYMIEGLTRLFTGYRDYAGQGHVGNPHLPALGHWFVLLTPVVAGILYGPLVYRFAREARGHGVPEVMVAVARNGGRIRPQVAVVKAIASALCIGGGGSVGREGPIVQIGSALGSSLGASWSSSTSGGSSCWWPAARPAGSRPPSTRRWPGCSSRWNSSCASGPPSRSGWSCCPR